MKTNLLLSRIIATQVQFKVLFNNKMKNSVKIFSLIRLKNPLSLIFKTILINDLFGLTTVTKKKSDFIFISAYVNSDYLKLDPQFNVLYKKLYESYTPNDKTRINNITFNKKFSISITINDIIPVVKRNKIENQYDFFNYPVNFNSTIELKPYDYIVISTFKNGI